MLKKIFSAVFVVGPGQQGIVFQHHEKVIGDRVNLEDVKIALDTVTPPIQ